MNKIDGLRSADFFESGNRLLLERTIFTPPRIGEDANALNLFLNHGEDPIIPARECDEDVKPLRINGSNQIDQTVFGAEEFVTKLMGSDQNAPAVIGTWWIKPRTTEVPVGEGRRSHRRRSPIERRRFRRRLQQTGGNEWTEVPSLAEAVDN